MKTANEVLKQARAWLGLNEKDGSHRRIIDIYNTQNPLPRGYKVKYNDQWCATFVSAVSVNLGYTDIMPTECSCAKMMQKYMNMGRWEEDDARTPNPGEVLFYDWKAPASGDSKGTPRHVGIVESVENGVITVVEGNHSDSVYRRKIPINYRYIRGYGLPAYDADPEPEKETLFVVTATAVTHSHERAMVYIDDAKKAGFTSSLLEAE